MKVSQQIEETYKNFEIFFKQELQLDLKEIDLAYVRDKFKEFISKGDVLFTDSNHAEDSFLYIYHYKELQEIKRVANYLLETGQHSLYEKIIMEFFNDYTESGLEDLKVHQINNESDKVWFSKHESTKEIIDSWRTERFSGYL